MNLRFDEVLLICDGELDRSCESELTNEEIKAVRSSRVVDEEGRKVLDSKRLFYMWERAVRGCLGRTDKCEYLEGLDCSNQHYQYEAGPSLW